MSDAGSAVTVEGPVDSETLGITLPDEHLFSSWPKKFDAPESAYERKLAREPIFAGQPLVRPQKPVSTSGEPPAGVDGGRHRGGHALPSGGGDTIVDVTPKGTSADPERVRGVGRETGVNFVHGTAFYTRYSHPNWVDTSTVDNLATEFTSDVTDGIDDTRVRPSIIGEIGTSGDIHDREAKGPAGRRAGVARNRHAGERPRALGPRPRVATPAAGVTSP